MPLVDFLQEIMGPDVGLGLGVWLACFLGGILLLFGGVL